MGTNLNRWLVSACWFLAVLALLSAAAKGSLGVAALWAMPCALLVTIAVAGWPRQAASRTLAFLGVVWQLALIGAYWPFQLKPTTFTLLAPNAWPMHTVLIGGVLVLLLIGFLSGFLWPALALRARLAKAARVLQDKGEQAQDAVEQIFHGDIGLQRSWQEYLNQVRTAPDAQWRPREFALVSAAAMFDLHLLTQSRLRLEFFKNLPGMLTGLGIIGTFTGLIMGLRQFRISENPSVVQASLEALLGGVWEAFLVSALAIALAIVVTVIEKLTLSSIARQADSLSYALDGLYPPRPQPESEVWVPRLLEVLQQLAAPADAASRAHLVTGATLAPMEQSTSAPPAPLPDPMHDLTPMLQQMSQHTIQASQALGTLAQQLPDLLGQQQQQTQQTLGQSIQVMRTLAGRLEGVASSVESSGRKTLETVAARLMQSEMNMVSRHQAVVEHLGELVQRIEALCGLMQHDRNDLLHGHGSSNTEADTNTAWSPRDNPYREPRDARSARVGPVLSQGYGVGAPVGIADEGFGNDWWNAPAPPPTRFGS